MGMKRLFDVNAKPTERPTGTLVSLRGVETEQLEKEIERRRRRLRQAPSVRPDQRRIYCEDCAYFVSDNPPPVCGLGFDMKIRVPETSFEVYMLDWGYYRTKCKAFKSAR
jgi:hypothetical protein